MFPITVAAKTPLVKNVQTLKPEPEVDCEGAGQAVTSLSSLYPAGMYLTWWLEGSLI